MKNKTLVVACSGGKDSTALALWIQFESGLENEQRFISCDTGHEHAWTYQHLDQLAVKLGQPILKLRGEHTFIEMAVHKKRFPSAKARFCTGALKIEPSIKYLETVPDSVLLTGIRAEESPVRGRMAEWVEAEDAGHYNVPLWRPLLKWTIKDVIQCHKRNGMAMNPLYLKGASRVGCWPCIMSRKSDLKAAFIADPDLLDRLRGYERLVGGTFFYDGTIPAVLHRAEPYFRDSLPHASIDAVNEWAMGEDHEDQINIFADPSCLSAYGLCE
ncbi:MAG: phosphoadenosine phosphosulfate reductase family protein [Candidatus Brocadiales bacterium]|nr:phosphoadenosine phosphosulfate reductase family protein [Candidatus Bathyanammoxibius sp.]